jgi:hypothetical protein
MDSPLEEDGFEPSVPLTRYAGLSRERVSYDDFAPPGSLSTLCLARNPEPLRSMRSSTGTWLRAKHGSPLTLR